MLRDLEQFSTNTLSIHIRECYTNHKVLWVSHETLYNYYIVSIVLAVRCLDSTEKISKRIETTKKQKIL